MYGVNVHNSNHYNIRRIHQIWPPVTYILFSNLKTCFCGIKLTLNEKVIIQTDAYFEDFRIFHVLDGLKM